MSLRQPFVFYKEIKRILGSKMLQVLCALETVSSSFYVRNMASSPHKKLFLSSVLFSILASCMSV